jgi:hypothetical protein
MRHAQQLAIGRLSVAPLPFVARLQSGGKRPPGGSNTARNARRPTRSAPAPREIRLRHWWPSGAFTATKAQTENPGFDLNGSYAFERQSAACSNAKLNSSISISAQNMRKVP